jgi:glycosyltransferase involved in cell wall biosynthesis
MLIGLRYRLMLLRYHLTVAMSFRHLHGPRRVALAPDQAGLVLLAKNAEWFLPAFLDHHFALGVAHVLVVDNGSTDRTPDIARRDRVTVVQSTLPVKRHEERMRAIAARRVFRGGWVLFADADEMAEMPLGAPLPRLLSYCNGRGFTAVLGQMIDLYAPAPTPGAAYPQAVAEATCYSTAQIDHRPYTDDPMGLSWFLKDNRCDDPGVRLLQGGLRREVFGENPFLTKHSLVRNAAPAQLMTHPHCASRVTVADVTLALRHYKLAGDWAARDRASLQAEAWEHNEDSRRQAAAARAGFRIAPAEPRLWRGAAALADEGFLYASAAARAALTPPG